jgi:hypothetical protein
MSSFAKTTVLSLTLLASAAFAAHAQSGNVAALPPGAATAPPAATTGPYPGPKAGNSWYITEQQTQAVAPSPKYIGPGPGGGWYPTTEKQTQAVTPSDKYPGVKPH